MCQFYYDCVGSTVQNYTGLPYFGKSSCNLCDDESKSADRSEQKAWNKAKWTTVYQATTIHLLLPDILCVYTPQKFYWLIMCCRIRLCCGVLQNWVICDIVWAGIIYRVCQKTYTHFKKEKTVWKLQYSMLPPFSFTVLPVAWWR